MALGEICCDNNVPVGVIGWHGLSFEENKKIQVDGAAPVKWHSGK